MYSETNSQIEPISLEQVQLSSLHWSTSSLQQAVSIHWQAVGQLKCTTPKKSTAKITTNILRPHIPLMQGQWSQPRLNKWRTNKLATASRWMDACQGHTSCSVKDDRWTSSRKLKFDKIRNGTARGKEQLMTTFLNRGTDTLDWSNVSMLGPPDSPLIALWSG